MPIEPTRDESTGTGGHEPQACPRIQPPLRLWPALLVLAAYLFVLGGYFLFGSASVHSVIGLAIAPIVAALLLLLWWVTVSRAGWRDKVGGLALFLAGLFLANYVHASDGVLILMIHLPVMIVGVVTLLVLTSRLRWPARRWILILFILGCTGFFVVIRAESLSGSLTPVLAWRWSPTVDERSTGLPALKPLGNVTLSAQAGPEDWTGFRGPARDGCLANTVFSMNWAAPPKELWRMRVGLGWSSFAAVGDYVFTQEQRDGEELVTCYRAETGESEWVNRLAVRFEDDMGSGPRGTPTFDQGKLYTQGATGVLQCLDAVTGNTIWKRDLTQDTDARIPTWGFSASPLVAGDLVVVYPGGSEGKSVAAYDRNTGEMRWHGGHPASSYSSPHFAVLGGVPQVLMNSDYGIQAFVPETGAPLWEHAWQTKSTSRVVQPLLAGGDTILLGTTTMDAGGGGTRRIHVEKQDTAWNVKEEWTVRAFRPYFNDLVLHKGHCYGFDGNRLACIDAATGELRWRGKRYGGQLLLLSAMDMLVILSEDGVVAFVRAIPEGFEEAGQFKAINGKTWNHPVVAHGKLFVRNAEEAACFELGPSSPKATP